MHSFVIDGVEHVIECNAFTPFIYAENFTTTRNGKTVPEDINAAVDEVMQFSQEHSLPPMLKLLQLFWAFEKTANSKVPGFRSWLRGLPKSCLSLTSEGGWAQAVMEEIDVCFFPDATGKDMASEGAGEPSSPAA